MARFATDAEADAYEACERSKGVAAMADDCLIAIVMGGLEKPDWDACQIELTRRVEGGNLGCQRAAFAILYVMWANQRIGDQLFLERAEPIARLAASGGDHRDASSLAGTLAIRAAWLRKIGGAEAGHAVEVEALTLLGTIANDATDNEVVTVATGDFATFALDFSPLALDEARLALWADGLAVEQEHEPEVVAAASRRK